MVVNCKETYKYSHYVLNYQQFGSGDRVMLCFHGFGESSNQYDFLGVNFGDDYTIYAFDFFYHGDDQKDLHIESTDFNKNDWVSLISAFIRDKNIPFVDIYGYSMGGRLSMILIEAIPDKINNVILVAPDGLFKSFWFNFATKNTMGKKLFLHFTKNPKPYIRMLHIFTMLGMLSPKLTQIAKINTQIKSKRVQVYNTWSLLSKLNVDLDKAESSISNHNLNINILTGNFDKIIPPIKVRKWTWITWNMDKFHVLDSGHLISYKKIIGVIKKYDMLG